MKILDVHAHYGKWFFPIESNSITEILNIMDKNNIERCIFSSSLAIIYNFREGNEDLAKAIKGDKRLLGYVFLNPNYLADSIKEMHRCLAKSNFAGIKLYSDGYIHQPLDCYGHKKFLEIFSKKYSNKIVLFHCHREKTILQSVKLAQEFPELHFIMGHMGEWDYEIAARETMGIENIYLEISTASPLAGKIEEVVKIKGDKGIVFGSDLTLLNPAYILGMLEDADISRKAKENILYGNAKTLIEAAEQ